MHAVGRITRAIGALLLLVVLVVGIPALLSLAVGWPLPSRIPDLDQIRTAFDGATITDSVLIDALACVAWTIWIVVVWSIVAEVAAWVRGRTAARVPFGGLVQPVVRELVVAVTLLFGSLRPATALASAPIADRPVFALSSSQHVPADDRSTDIAANGTVEATCTVKPRDNLWRLAEEHLGDGTRWRDIWLLNEGLVQTDGRTFDDPNLIRPGWMLRMPSDATGVDLPAPAQTAPTPVPEVPSPAEPVPPPAPLIPSATVAATESSSETPPPDESRSENHDDPDFELLPMLAGSALIAAGVVKTLNKLRQRQVRHAEPGADIPLPQAQVRATEVSLRHAAAEDEYDRLDMAVRNLAACVRGAETNRDPVIDTVMVGPDGVEIRLREALDGTSGPFVVTDEGRTWILPPSVRDEDLTDVGIRTTGPSPGLVTIGTTERGSVLIDLEAVPRTLVGGDPVDASALLWTMLLDLATSSRADDVEVIVVGTLPAGIDVLDRVRTVVELSDVIDELDRRSTAIASALTMAGHRSIRAARLDEGGDCWAPVVVFVGRHCSQQEIERVLEIAEREAGVAVVVVGEADAEFDRELCVEGDTLVVKPVGLRVRPSSLPADAIAASGTILATAADVQSSGVSATPSGPSCNGHEKSLGGLRVDTDGSPHVPPGHVLVRVLGPVDIVGGDRPVDRRRCIEFVAYLALHRDGVDESRLRAALWPESTPTRTAFNETVSRARRCLGLDPGGQPHVRYVDNGIYRVGQYVHVDSELITAGVSGAEAVARGLPFQGTRGFEWAYEEGLAYSLQRLVDLRHQDNPMATSG